jgi:hypothetical protein
MDIWIVIKDEIAYPEACASREASSLVQSGARRPAFFFYHAVFG